MTHITPCHCKRLLSRGVACFVFCSLRAFACAGPLQTERKKWDEKEYEASVALDESSDEEDRHRSKLNRPALHFSRFCRMLQRLYFLTVVHRFISVVHPASECLQFSVFFRLPSLSESL